MHADVSPLGVGLRQLRSAVRGPPPTESDRETVADPEDEIEDLEKPLTRKSRRASRKGKDPVTSQERRRLEPHVTHRGSLTRLNRVALWALW
jgi:hypothetical protein